MRTDYNLILLPTKRNSNIRDYSVSWHCWRQQSLGYSSGKDLVLKLTYNEVEKSVKLLGEANSSSIYQYSFFTLSGVTYFKTMY